MELRLKSEEQEQLVLNNEGLVRYIAKGFRIANADYEDVISIGRSIFIYLVYQI